MILYKNLIVHKSKYETLSSDDTTQTHRKVRDCKKMLYLASSS